MHTRTTRAPMRKRLQSSMRSRSPVEEVWPGASLGEERARNSVEPHMQGGGVLSHSPVRQRLAGVRDSQDRLDRAPLGCDNGFEINLRCEARLPNGMRWSAEALGCSSALLVQYIFLSCTSSPTMPCPNVAVPPPPTCPCRQRSAPFSKKRNLDADACGL